MAPRRPRATSTDERHPWAALAAERGLDAAFVEDDGILPAVARMEGGRFLLKSGRVGGAEGEAGSREISESLVTTVIDAALRGEVQWEEDPDFGYEVAAAVPGVEPPDDGLLLPRLLYTRADRVYEHAEIVPRVQEQVRGLARA
jgi:ATP-dependent phosphoenolpyruvate carboxykinase